MEPTMKRVFMLSVVVLSGCAASSSSMNHGSVPPILRGVTAHGGWWGHVHRVAKPKQNLAGLCGSLRCRLNLAVASKMHFLPDRPSRL